ncbi:TetR/AcrR family transcriptional regulator [Mycobacterium sp. 134]|uniref:TetR/AcrR family transcriptional regulator n=1 Tax=Mycobacterium sp. 134 TaxID=3400425 RepID=UPI003AACCFDE
MTDVLSFGMTTCDVKTGVREVTGAEGVAAGAGHRRYAGMSAEQRRAVRRRALLDAAKDLWREGGLPAVSVRAISARAKLTDRYFYEQFADIGALIGAVIDDILEESFTAMIEAGSAPPESATVETRLTLGLAAFVEHAESDPLAVRIYLTDARHVDAAARHIRVAQYRVAAAILSVLQPDRDADPESFDAALFCVGGVTTLLNERLLDPSKAVAAHHFAAQAVIWCTRILGTGNDPGGSPRSTG